MPPVCRTELTIVQSVQYLRHFEHLIAFLDHFRNIQRHYHLISASFHCTIYLLFVFFQQINYT